MNDKTVKILKSDNEKQYILAIVYEPDSIDTDGQFAKAEVIEKACWEYGKKLFKGEARTGYEHLDGNIHTGIVVENYIQKQDTVINEQIVKSGTWLQGLILEPEYFEGVKNGDINGLSLEGLGLVLTTGE